MFCKIKVRTSSHRVHIKFQQKTPNWVFFVCYNQFMKLYLSSFRIPDVEKFCSFVGKPANKIKIGLVFNSKDYKPQEERDFKLQEHFDYYHGLGFEIKEVNLLDFESPKELESALLGYDIVWFNGGNTYYLRWAIKKSGAEKVIKNILDKGVVYAGDGAGAVIAGPTLEHYEIADDPSVAPEHITDGLQLFDTALIPHWGSEEYSEVLGKLEKKLIDDAYKTLRLTDDEFLMIEDGVVLK